MPQLLGTWHSSSLNREGMKIFLGSHLAYWNQAAGELGWEHPMPRGIHGSQRTPFRSQFSPTTRTVGIKLESLDLAAGTLSLGTIPPALAATFWGSDMFSWFLPTSRFLLLHDCLPGCESFASRLLLTLWSGILKILLLPWFTVGNHSLQLW